MTSLLTNYRRNLIINMAQIFISYRREGGREIARNVSDRLTNDGYATFFDYDSLRDGEFNKEIFHTIEGVNDFVFILTEGSLDNCTDENDWVRMEIEHAVKHKKHIILYGPVGKNFSFPNLPESIASITNIQITPLDYNYYNEGYKRLKDRLISRKIRIIRNCLILIFLLLGLFVWKGPDFMKKPIKVNSDVYLLRYTDEEIRDFFPDSIRSKFQYTHSEEGGYHVFPIHGDTLSPSIYHYPMFRIRLVNKNNNTVGLNRAYVEIKNYKVIDNNLAQNDEKSANPPKYTMAELEMPVVQIGSRKDNSYYLQAFDRKLGKKENDTAFCFALSCNESCQFDMRIKILSEKDDTLYTNPVNVKYYQPLNAFLVPEYKSVE